jgi:endothelin-converting enzyme/putative endopeptidase
MTEQIELALHDDLSGLEWMSEPTRRLAQQKLAAIANKIGYPEHWRDYSGVLIERNALYANFTRANRFEALRQIAKIGHPVDRDEWDMTAATVNADYDDQLNAISFPAGVLQPPLFDPASDDAPNFGDTGATIGHELTHGFDDEGRKYDARGNLRNWWAKEDARRFEERAACIVKQFDGFTVLDNLHINGRLSAGENIADLGGLVLAWMAWRLHGEGVSGAPIDGLTPAQRFFVGYAQWACENVRDEDLRVEVETDVHPPARFRVNGPLANMTQFAEAFSCHAGQPMVAVHACRIW